MIPNPVHSYQDNKHNSLIYSTIKKKYTVIG